MRTGYMGWADPALVANSGTSSPFLLLGDHAGREVPPELAQLGLMEADLARHIGWDIGVFGLGQRLARTLDATFISQRFSRLVIDSNRDPMRADAVPEISDGTTVPGNLAIDEHERSARVAGIFTPYHNRIAAELDARAARGMPTIVVALHSFTPVMQGFQRPWHVGVLWNDDPRLPEPLLAELRRDSSLVVGDNEPYSARASYEYTLNAHARPRRLPHCSLEVRQDLIGTPHEARTWGRRLAPAIRAAVAVALS